MGSNHTREDAFERIFPAKLSCLVDASETYLKALREYLYAWAREIDTKLAELRIQHAARQSCVEMYGEELGSEEGHIGYLCGSQVWCCQCQSSFHPADRNPDAAKLYRVNVEPYKQSCHYCGKEMVKGRTPAWCELFPKDR